VDRAALSIEIYVIIIVDDIIENVYFAIWYHQSGGEIHITDSCLRTCGIIVYFIRLNCDIAGTFHHKFQQKFWPLLYENLITFALRIPSFPYRLGHDEIYDEI